MKQILFLAGVLLLLQQPSSGKTDPLKANVSVINITPPLSMKYTLGGYGERMNKPAISIHDSIFAKALVLQKNNRKYLVMTLDLLGLPSNVKVDLIKRVSGLGWKSENMMLLPSHSHGSLEMAALNNKNTLNIPQLGIYQPELLEFLLNKLELLVRSADTNYKEVKIGTGSKQIEGANRNRRKDPEVDKELMVTRIDLMNGDPLAVLVNWTAHPTFIGGKDMQVSAEWPGYLQSELESTIGKGAKVLYFNGAEGDQSTILSTAATDDYQKIQIYGKQMAGISYELYKEIKTEEKADLDYCYNIIKLPEHKAHPSFMKTGGDEYGLTESSVKIVMNILCPESVGIGSVKIGALLISGIPGEPTAILGLKIKKSLRVGAVKYVAIGGLANEWISYILDKDQYLHGEGYESSMSFFGPDLGQVITDETIANSMKLIH
jgi:hypothetical protein